MGGYAPTPAIWPPLIGAIFVAATGLYAWRHGNVPASAPWFPAPQCCR